MPKKLKIMSLSVEPEMQDLLKISSKKLGCSVSALVRDLVNKHLDLLVNDGEEIPVILRIPTGLKGDKESLEKWLASRVSAIADALS
jgi:hypothetical protein